MKKIYLIANRHVAGKSLLANLIAYNKTRIANNIGFIEVNCAYLKPLGFFEKYDNNDYDRIGANILNLIEDLSNDPYRNTFYVDLGCSESRDILYLFERFHPLEIKNELKRLNIYLCLILPIWGGYTKALTIEFAENIIECTEDLIPIKIAVNQFGLSSEYIERILSHFKEYDPFVYGSNVNSHVVNCIGRLNTNEFKLDSLRLGLKLPIKKLLSQVKHL